MKQILSILTLCAILFQSCEPSSSNTQEQNEHEEFEKASEISRHERDSVEKAESIAFSKTKAGKIYKKHPDWSKEDCELLSKGKIWIGMSIDMVYYLRGTANARNDSNYGRGEDYQYVWYDYNPKCFYTHDDGIVYAYN